MPRSRGSNNGVRVLTRSATAPGCRARLLAKRAHVCFRLSNRHTELTAPPPATGDRTIQANAKAATAR
jgi:hypothetical protein